MSAIYISINHRPIVSNPFIVFSPLHRSKKILCHTTTFWSPAHRIITELKSPPRSELLAVFTPQHCSCQNSPWLSFPSEWDPGPPHAPGPVWTSPELLGTRPFFLPAPGSSWRVLSRGHRGCPWPEVPCVGSSHGCLSPFSSIKRHLTQPLPLNKVTRTHIHRHIYFLLK